MLIIDKLAYQSRWLHVAPHRKAWLYVVLLVLAFSCPPLAQMGLLAGMVLLTCYLLKVSLWRYLRWLMVPLFFLLFGLLGIVFSIAWAPALPVPHSLTLGPLVIGPDPVGIATAWHTLWRSLAALAATYLFVLTTPFNQLIGLLKRCHLPKLLLEQILLTYRFIFILIEEAMAIHQAQTLRFGYSSPGNGYRSLAMLVGMLLARVMDRYAQMETTLDVKLFTGEFHL
jgi:cobalt/nickel transport system permease protein